MQLGISRRMFNPSPNPAMPVNSMEADTYAAVRIFNKEKNKES